MFPLVTKHSDRRRKASSTVYSAAENRKLCLLIETDKSGRKLIDREKMGSDIMEHSSVQCSQLLYAQAHFTVFLLRATW